MTLIPMRIIRSIATNQSCLRCHEGIEKSHTTAVVTTDSDCVGCHMQKMKSPMGWMEFTNHWIRNPDQPVPRGTVEEPAMYALLEKAYRCAFIRPQCGRGSQVDDCDKFG